MCSWLGRRYGRDRGMDRIAPTVSQTRPADTIPPMASAESGTSTEPGSGAGAPGGEPLCALVGPTAAGKSELALLLAERWDAEIVSVDSMQVYRGMDVGTAKPGPGERARVPHHLLDRVDPPERYDAQRYLADVERAVSEIRARGRRVLFAGGTGFYLKALTHGLFGGPAVDPALRAELEARARAEGGEALHAELQSVDPEAAGRLHPADRRRVVRALEVWRQTGRRLSDWQREWRGRPGRPRRICGIARRPEELAQRIAARTRAMLDAGWADEARAIRDGVGFGPTSIQALGYREALLLADGELGRAEAEQAVALRTRQFARRQGTWFRKFPEIEWLPGAETPEDLLPRAARALGWD